MYQKVHFGCAIPVGAWHDFLPDALDSLRQQEQPLEVAFLDASSDHRVVDAARRSGLHFSYHRVGPDNGQAGAIAEGWQSIGGNVLFWLNADDQLLPDALNRVAARFEQGDKPEIVFGGSKFVNRAGETIGHHDQVDDVTQYIFRSNVVSQPSCFVSRQAIERIGGINQELHYTMDWDLWVRLYQSGAKFVRLNEDLSSVYMGEGTKTGHVSMRRLMEVYKLVHRHADWWSAVKSTSATFLHTILNRNKFA